MNLAFWWKLQIHKVSDYSPVPMYSVTYFLLYLTVSLTSFIRYLSHIPSVELEVYEKGISLHRAAAHQELVKLSVIGVERLLMQTIDSSWFYESQLPNRDGNK